MTPKCCDNEMISITNKFNETESHLMGPEWSHWICEKCGTGGHDKMITETESETIKLIQGNKLPAKIEARMEEIKQQQLNITTLEEYINEQEQNGNIVKLKKMIEKIENEIDKLRETLHINEQKGMLIEMQQALEEMVNETATQIPSNVWGVDAFSKGKKDVVASNNGKIFILRSKRIERTIIPDKFWQMYPFLVEKYVKEGRLKITLKEASKDLGEKDIDSVSEKEISYKYELKVKE